MKRLLLILVLALAGAPAVARAAAAWTPLRLAIECQSYGRTKACPDFLRGFIDEIPVLAYAPLASAQVVLRVNITFLGNDDLIHLRFTSKAAGAPPVYELTQTVSSRGTDDEQRNQLRPAFARGVAVYLGVLLPASVEVTFTAPTAAATVAAATTPWSYHLNGGGFLSLGGDFQSGEFWSGAGATRVTTSSQLWLNVSGRVGVTRQPPLIIDGQEIPLDSDSYGVTATGLASFSLTPFSAVGALLRGGHEDDHGRFASTARAHVGFSRDFYRSDDPRGNVFSAIYLMGFQHDRYHARNVLGETAAQFASHALLVSGSVRKDKISYSITASGFAELLDPAERYILALSPGMQIQVGTHLDLGFSIGITKQAVPGPADVDQGNFEEVTRASYAEPLNINGYFNIRLHWDRTNQARNNRMDPVGGLDALGTL